ncbi:MAG: hypothetical protein ACD_80C00084G0002 [uncultured bacterium (gcode 4)]|uniref:Uncharacterized protein n=1 Tax=uncultured bacterium (gcode 4) TaxID=1234023 RepID=K1XJE9_9BACT|nr:MAG: hypothetical protein ACD_80C00084G0002 [uncultured bacterium (gcode 4)]
MTGINTLRQEENSKQNKIKNKKDELLENLDLQNSKKLVQDLVKRGYKDLLNYCSLKSAFDDIKEEWKQIEKYIDDIFSNKPNKLEEKDIFFIKTVMKDEISTRKWKREMTTRQKEKVLELENALKSFEGLVKK